MTCPDYVYARTAFLVPTNTRNTKNQHSEGIYSNLINMFVDYGTRENTCRIKPV